MLNAARDVVITIGMLFFLFSTWFENNLARLKGRVRTITLTSILGVIVPFAFGYVAALALPGLWGTPLQTTGFLLPVFIGTALSISALPVIARILTDLDLLDKELGGVIITTAVINDLIGWCLFAVNLGALDSGNPNNTIWGKFGLVLAIIFLVWIFSRWLIKPFLHWAQQVFNWTGGFMALVVSWIFAAAAVTEQLGLQPVLGAFQVGVVLGQNLEIDKKHAAFEIIREFAISFLRLCILSLSGSKQTLSGILILPLSL